MSFPSFLQHCVSPSRRAQVAQTRIPQGPDGLFDDSGWSFEPPLPQQRSAVREDSRNPFAALVQPHKYTQ
jgi:hypothetical protein